MLFFLGMQSCHAIKETKLMKLARWISTAALSMFLATFLLGTTALIQAQDQRDEAKPAEPDNHPEAAKPSKDEPGPRSEEAKPSKQNEDKPAKQDDAKSRQREDDAKPQAEGEARQGQSNEQSMEGAQSTGGRRGGRIPDDKFRASFGRQHTFAIGHPNRVQGRPTFQYGGYSFTLVDAWPADWAYTDECYIDYIDGEYFLFDLAHPGVQLAIVVVL